MTDGLNNEPPDGESLDFQHFRVPFVDGHPVELGRGAMGITYKAFDRNLRVPVALKVINPALLSGASARDRFLREARSAAALRHPNVATVLHLGEQEGGVFYAMEFIDGETVEAYIRRENAMPPVLALRIVSQVASALVAAEKEGIIHRDIKPSNIMLIHGGDGSVHVKVIDFGLAKSVESTPDSATVTLTQGGFLGTPHFASPEQLEEREVDTRSDIYSLGVTLFYMLAGKTPFSGSMAQVMSQHLYRQPPLELLSDEPPAVMALLEAMLAKSPDDRPATAVELKRRVDACIEELTGARPAATMLPPAGPPEPGEVLAGRFALVKPLGAVGEFLRFAARDGDRPDAEVEVVFPAANVPVVPGLADALRQRVAAVERVEAAALRRVLTRGASARGWFYAAEAISGTTLLDVLRGRGALPPGEALLVLRPLAAALDALDEARAPRPPLALHEVILVPKADPSTPLPRWPGLQAKIDAVRLERLVEQPGDVTLVASSVAVLRRDADDATASAAFELAGLAYEMLGGSRFDSVHNRWTPLAEVPPAMNQALERGLCGDPGFATATEFVSALAATASTSTRPERAATVPPAPPDPSAPVPVARPARALNAPVMLVLAGVALLLVVFVGGAALLLIPRAGEPPKSIAASPTPAATPTPLVVSEPNQPTPSPTATPGPTPDPAALAAAREIERESRFAEALVAYSRLLAEIPGNTDLRDSLQRVAASLESAQPDVLPATQLMTLRVPLEQAANLGSPSAQVLLATALFDAEPEAALRWFEEAARQGRTDAMVRAGQMLSNGRGVAVPDFRRAATWFEEAAQRNDVNGMLFLADSHRRGLGVPQNPTRAAEILETAAAFGDDRAIELLAELYERGEGVQANMDRAIELYEKAAAMGNLYAKANLGVVYIRGVGVKRDPKKAMQLWREGAEMGDPKCMYLYALGLQDPAVGRDRNAAREWFIRAAQKGHEEALIWCRNNGVEVPAEAAKAAPSAPPDPTVPLAQP